MLLKKKKVASFSSQPSPVHLLTCQCSRTSMQAYAAMKNHQSSNISYYSKLSAFFLKLHSIIFEQHSVTVKSHLFEATFNLMGFVLVNFLGSGYVDFFPCQQHHFNFHHALTPYDICNWRDVTFDTNSCIDE